MAELLRSFPVGRDRADLLILCLTPLVLSVVAAALDITRGLLAFAAVGLGYLMGWIIWVVVNRRTGGAGYVSPSNLPPPPTRVVGREQEVTQLREYLLSGAPDGPLIANVCGVPGIGKNSI